MYCTVQHYCTVLTTIMRQGVSFGCRVRVVRGGTVAVQCASAVQCGRCDMCARARVCVCVWRVVGLLFRCVCVCVRVCVRACVRAFGTLAVVL